MSKKLQKKAGKLVRKAEDRATTIRRVVMEYNNAAEIMNVTDYAKQREIERAVVKYNEAHKAIKRLRRKMALKSKQTAGRRLATCNEHIASESSIRANPSNQCHPRPILR